jgi:hypothetical protein
MYIREKMEEHLPEWKENEFAYDGEINNNFYINFQYLKNKISFIKDRGLLELNFYYQNEQVHFDCDMYDSILKYIPEQNSKWILSICTELIDYYINFLKNEYQHRFSCIKSSPKFKKKRRE